MDASLALWSREISKEVSALRTEARRLDEAVDPAGHFNK